MAKDRARPFSRKHRRYWIPVTGGMILIGVINVILGYCSYTEPSDRHERIVPDVPGVPGGSAIAAARPSTAAPRPATGCAPAIVARVAADMPGATITACTPDRATVVRGEHQIELTVAGEDIVEVAEPLTRPEIPAAVMRAFAIAYPRMIPGGAVKRTRRGADAVYEVAFPPGAPHAVATLRDDGTVTGVR
ncbi:MAG: hypothetical protein E6J90_27655 [Deltaproteobacteria bacterium]|nr:MAG: hypothetical protein E6J91_27610 [Deltaproteobacteria bacterium]TMQ13899.1 MAG: hypothetical protein E6J90_27655 [Deltaproteobacteria bacterium]